MPWRRRPMAATRSSRSAVMPVICCSSSSASSSARRLTAPMVSRSCTSRSSLCSAFSSSGSSSIDCTSASASTPSVSQRSRSCDALDHRLAVLGRLLHQALAPHAALARRRPARPRPCASPCRPRPAASRRRRAGRPPPGASARPWRSPRPAPCCLASISAGRAASSAMAAAICSRARIELADLAVGVGQALAPARMVLRDAAQPLDPHLGLARQAVAGRLRPRPARRAARRCAPAACRPPRGRPGCRRSTTAAPGGRCGASRRRRRRPRSRPSSARCRPGACAAGRCGAPPRRAGRAPGSPPRSAAAMALCAARSAARVASPASCALRRAASATCALVLRAPARRRASRPRAPRPASASCRRPCACAFGLLGHDAVDLLADIGQPVALAEAHRRGRRRAGPHRVAVPAPHRAFDGDQLLAGLEARLQRGTRRIVGDDADEADAALELGQRLDMRAERRRPFRQRRRVGQRAERQPMGRRTAIRRGFEILAERRAQRLFEARRDRHRIEQRRPQRARRRLQRRGDACLLGAQLGEPRVGLLQQLVGGGIARLGGAAARRREPAPSRCARLRPARRPGAPRPIRSARPRAPARSTPRPECELPPRPARAASSAASTSGSAGRFDSSLSIWRCWPATSARRDFEPAQALLHFGDLAADAVAQRLVVGDLAGQAIMLALRRRPWPPAPRRAPARRPRRARPRRPAPPRADALAIEIGDRGLGIALAAALAREVAFGLLQAGFGLLLRRRDPLGLGGQRIVRHAQALQGRSGGGLVVAQRRQRGRRLGLRRRGEANQPRQVGDLRLGFLQALAGFGQLALGPGELQRQHGRLRRGGYGPTGCGSGWPGAPGASGPCAAPRGRPARPARARGSARRRAAAARPRGGGHRGR